MNLKTYEPISHKTYELVYLFTYNIHPYIKYKILNFHFIFWAVRFIFLRNSKIVNI